MINGKLSRLARDFYRSRRGSVAILFAAALLPLVIAIGVGVDYGRALLVRDRMHEAADAAALAIGSWPDMSEKDLKAKARQFFDANYPESKLGAVGTLNVRFDDDNNIYVTVNGEVPTTFMHLANVKQMDVAAETMVSREQRNIELVLVLDTTGSMGDGGKMTALKRAANEMVKILFDGKTESETLRIGVVPFSGAVNIGSHRSNSPWLDTGGRSSIAREDFDGNPKALQLFSQLRNRSWAGCVRERGGEHELDDTPPTNSDKESLFAPYLAPDEPDPENHAQRYWGGWYNTTSYNNNYLEDGCTPEAEANRWTSNVCGSDAAVQRQTGKYANAYVKEPDWYNRPPGPNSNCAASEVTPLTNKKSTIDDAIAALEPEGSTVIPAGLLWGWRLLSPNEPFAEGAAYEDEEWVKAIVLLTDGENSVGGGGNEHNKSFYNAFGYAAKGHLGSTNGRQAEAELDSKTFTVCEKIKAQKILIYTIGFQVSGSVQNMLRNCATDPDDMAYNSPSNSELAGIFNDIAQGLSDLRIAQ